MTTGTPSPGTKPRDIKLRRYGLYRMIPGFDLPEGQELLTVGKQEFVFLGLVDESPKIYLDLDGMPDSKQRFNYFSRDADFDGDVQDGTEHQRRSRSLTHLIFSRRAAKPVQVRRNRLRDLPVEVLFPNGPSKPVPSSISEKPKGKDLFPALRRNDLPFASKAAKKPGLQTFSGGAEIGKGKISIDGPGIRNAVSKGAVVDEAGHLRCPPMTPGAMQFTNWRLEGCGSPRKITRKKIQLAAEELAEFTAAGGRTLTQAEIANYRASAEGRTVGMTPNIRQRQRVSRKLQGVAEGAKAPKGEREFTGLAEMLKKSKSDSVRLDLGSGDLPGSGLAIPRSESSASLDMSKIADGDGNLTEEGAAQIVDWLDGVMNEPGREGAISSMVSITQVHPPKRPYDPDKPPLSGKAQDLADLADGDFNKFMDLLAEQDIIIFDFETTGMGADGNMPVEVAALRVRNGKVVDRKHIYMNPGRPMGKWSRDNLKGPDGNPLTDEWLSDQASLEDAMRELTDFMGDSIVVAHNAPFDTEILERVTAEQGIDFKPAGVIDTLTLSRQMIPKSETPEGRHTLQALAKHFGVEMDSWHTAWSDTDSLVGIMAGLRQRGIDRPVDPKILDKEYQAQKYAAAVEKFNADMEVYKKAIADFEATWGTKKSVARLDVYDIFDEKATGSKKAQQEAFQSVLDIADQEGSPHIIRLSDGTVTSVAEDITPRVGEIDSSFNPTRARIVNDAKTRLDAAFSKLEGKDNMNLDAFTADQVRSMLTEWKKVPGFEWIDPEDPDHLYLAIDQGARNILKLAESADPKDIAIHRRWYEAANKFGIDLGEHHAFSKESAIAVIAVLSPTQDWNGNIALADHVMALLNDKDFTVDDELADIVAASIVQAHQSARKPKGSLSKKIATRESKIADLQQSITELKQSIDSEAALKKAQDDLAVLEKELADLKIEFDTPPLPVEEIKGKKLSELDMDTKARVVKFHAQFFGGSYLDQPEIAGKGGSLRAYSMDVDADGNYVLGNQDNRVRVQSLTQYKKALRILESDKNKKPDLALIDKELGKGSKVRSFYNNIYMPNDERYADVTADTHHFGAATLVPVSASHEILDAIFKSSGASGASNAYPLVRAMTVLATSRWNAEHDDDLMPRAMQSIAWERIRSLIPTKFENPKKPGSITSDSSLKSYITDTSAQIVRLTSGDKPKRRDLVGREIELLTELSNALQKASKGDERNAALEAFRKEYKLPKLTEKDRLARELKVRNGVVVAIDKETGLEVEVDDLSPEALAELIGKTKPKKIKVTDVAYIRTRQDEAVDSVASSLHEAWRAPRKRDDGSFEPRLKDDGSGGQVDIANTPYAELPSKWQEENKLAAQHAVESILSNPSMSDDSIADLVHAEWLRRNGSWAPAEQKLPYAELSQEEKDKDLAVVRAAREALLEILGSKPKTRTKQAGVLLATGVLFPVR